MAEASTGPSGEVLSGTGPDAGGQQPRAPKLSGTVRAVVDSGTDPVPVTDLIDGVLRLHRPELADGYLRQWPHRGRRWPSGGLEQTSDRWLEEAWMLLQGDVVFGRVAVVAWALLDDAVAHEAVRSGLLGGLAAETTPRLADHLSEAGVALLRRRAPLVALQEGLLDPAFHLSSVDSTEQPLQLALHRAPRAGRDIGRWALAYSERVVAGTGPAYVRAYPAPEDDELDLRKGPAPVIRAVGWSTRSELHIVLGAGGSASGVVRLDASMRKLEQPPWPYAVTAAVSEGAMVILDVNDSGQEVFWGETGDGGAVPLAQPKWPTERLAVAGERVAALSHRAEGVLGLTTGDRSWTTYPAPAGALSVAATPDHALVGDEAGMVHQVGWDGSGRGVVQALDGQPVRQLVAGQDLAVASSGKQIGILAGGALVARWQLAGSQPLADSDGAAAPVLKKVTVSVDPAA